MSRVTPCYSCASEYWRIGARRIPVAPFRLTSHGLAAVYTDTSTCVAAWCWATWAHKCATVAHSNTRISPGVLCPQAPSSPRHLAVAVVGVVTAHPIPLLRGWCSLVDERIAQWQMANSGSWAIKSENVHVEGKLSTLHILLRQYTRTQGMHGRVRHIMKHLRQQAMHHTLVQRR